MSRVTHKLFIPGMSEREVDAAYFVLGEIQRRYPRIKGIEAPVLKLLSELTMEPTRGARWLQRTVIELELDFATEQIEIEHLTPELIDIGQRALPTNWQKSLAGKFVGIRD